MLFDVYKRDCYDNYSRTVNSFLKIDGAAHILAYSVFLKILLQR